MKSRLQKAIEASLSEIEAINNATVQVRADQKPIYLVVHRFNSIEGITLIEYQLENEYDRKINSAFFEETELDYKIKLVEANLKISDLSQLEKSLKKVKRELWYNLEFEYQRIST